MGLYCIFSLTFLPKNLIYESHCGLCKIAEFDVGRINR